MIIKSHNGAMREFSNMHNYKKQSEIELTVIDWCNKHNVSMAIDCMGATIRDKWECDAWNITFYRHGKKECFNTQFYTGIGHRIKNGFTKDKKPIIPHVASILHSLTMDVAANDYSFNNWCDDYGYDADSIKALCVYQACCNTAKELYKLFNRSELSALSELLQDYLLFL